MATKLERITIYFPKPLLDDLRKYVPARKRSAVIAEATAKEVRRIKMASVLEDAFGAWRDEDHPELATPEDVDRFVHDLRARWQPPSEGEEESRA